MGCWLIVSYHAELLSLKVIFVCPLRNPEQAFPVASAPFVLIKHCHVGVREAAFYEYFDASLTARDSFPSAVLRAKAYCYLHAGLALFSKDHHLR